MPKWKKIPNLGKVWYRLFFDGTNNEIKRLTIENEKNKSKIWRLQIESLDYSNKNNRYTMKSDINRLTKKISFVLLSNFPSFI